MMIAKIDSVINKLHSINENVKSIIDILDETICLLEEMEEEDDKL